MPAALEGRDRDASELPEDPVVFSKPRPSAGLLGEIYLPWLLGVIAFILAYLKAGLWILSATWQDRLLDRTISASAILVAYLLTAITILPALEEKQAIQRLRRWNYFKYVASYLGRATWSAGVLLLLSLAATPLPGSWKSKPSFDPIFSATWWSVFAFTVGAVFVATKVLLKLVRAR